MTEVVLENVKDVTLPSLSNISLDLKVIVGRSKMKLNDVSKLGPNAIIPMNIVIGNKVEIEVNGTVIAYGELISYGDTLSVKLTEVAKKED